MTAEENDALRRAILQRRFFGSRTETTAGALRYRGAVSAMTATTRQRIAEAVLNFRGTFDDETHASASFEWGDYAAPYQVTFQVGDDTLTIGATPL